MKRFSFLTLALGAAIVASAAPITKSAVVNRVNLGAKDKMLSDLKIELPARSNTTPKRVISNISDLAGAYEWSSTTLLNQMAPDFLTISVSNESTGECIVSLANQFDLKGVYDKEAGTLSIPNDQYLGEDEDGDIFFYLKPVDTTTGSIGNGKTDDIATVGTISGNRITFPELDIWAIGDYKNENLGFYIMTYANVFEKEEVGGDPNEGWTSLGNATLMDGWLLPGIGFDQFDESNWYEVELQQNNSDANVYRLVDPYKGNSPAAQYNASDKIGYIQFDVTDPDHVTFATVDAGFSNSQVGITKFYCMNALTTILLKNPGYTVDDILAAMGDELPYTTFKDGVVSLSFILDEDNLILNDARFGIQGKIDAGYIWTEQSQLPLDMSAKIFFPNRNGVEVISSDNNANEVYYNLQGLRIENPAKGQIVIVRKGDKASKIIVR